MSHAVRVTLPDGAALHVTDHGPGHGPALVCVHGFGLDARCWAPQATHFGRARRVVMPELRGYGRSDRPAAPYRHGADVGAVLDALSIDRAVLMGVSLGAGVVASLALDRPERVAALVLVSPLIRGLPTPDLMDLLKQVWAVAAAQGADAARTAWAGSALFAPTRRFPAAARALDAMLADYHGWHWLHRDPERAPDPPLPARLPAVHTPVLAITGAQDLPDFAATAQAVCERVPGARHVTLDGCGHLPQLERPALFNATLRDFLAGLAPV